MEQVRLNDTVAMALQTEKRALIAGSVLDSHWLGSSISPSVKKGALVVLRAGNPVPSVIPFQYNPETIQRTLQPQISAPAESGGPSPPTLQGPPIQTISFDLDFDATDQLEKADPLAVSEGILPQLAALELIMYPTPAKGAPLPQEAPLTILVLGARLIPVLLTQCTVLEQAFDPSLNPIEQRCLWD